MGILMTMGLKVQNMKNLVYDKKFGIIKLKDYMKKSY